MDQEKFEVYDSDKKDIVVTLLLLSSPAFLLVIFWVVLDLFNSTNPRVDLFPFIGGLLIILLPVYALLPAFLFNRLDKVHVLISDEKIEVNRRYVNIFQVYWSDLTKIKQIRERYVPPRAIFRRIGLKLVFFHSETSILRLWTFSFHKKNRKLFLSKVKDLANKKKIEFIEVKEIEKVRKKEGIKMKTTLD